MAEITIQLVGGEKDGWPDRIEVEPGTRPDLVYIWRGKDDDKVNKARGDARKVLADKLGVLAYRFFEVKEKVGCINSMEYRYVRYPEADKKVAHG